MDEFSKLVLECIQINAQSIANILQPYLEKSDGAVSVEKEAAHWGFVGATGAGGGAIGGAVGGPPGMVIGSGAGGFAGEMLWALFHYDFPEDSQPKSLFGQMLIEKYGPNLQDLADHTPWQVYQEAVTSGVLDDYLKFYNLLSVPVPIETLQAMFSVWAPYHYLSGADTFSPEESEAFEAFNQFLTPEQLLNVNLPPLPEVDPSDLYTMNESIPIDAFQGYLFAITQSWLEEFKPEAEKPQEKVGILEHLDSRLAIIGGRIDALHSELAAHGALINGIYAQLAHLTDPYTAPERMAVLPPGVREITE